MVTRIRLRMIVGTVGLYALAVALIGYFGINAYSGKHGLRAKQALEEQQSQLSAELRRMRNERKSWERRVALLRSDKLDPDMVDERARTLLNYVDPRDLTFLVQTPPRQPQ
jgi:cell division protein FtsB